MQCKRFATVVVILGVGFLFHLNLASCSPIEVFAPISLNASKVGGLFRTRLLNQMPELGIIPVQEFGDYFSLVLEFGVADNKKSSQRKGLGVILTINGRRVSTYSFPTELSYYFEVTNEDARACSIEMAVTSCPRSMVISNDLLNSTGYYLTERMKWANLRGEQLTTSYCTSMANSVNTLIDFAVNNFTLSNETKAQIIDYISSVNQDLGRAILSRKDLASLSAVHLSDLRIMIESRIQDQKALEERLNGRAEELAQLNAEVERLQSERRALELIRTGLEQQQDRTNRSMQAQQDLENKIQGASKKFITLLKAKEELSLQKPQVHIQFDSSLHDVLTKSGWSSVEQYQSIQHALSSYVTSELNRILTILGDKVENVSLTFNGLVQVMSVDTGSFWFRRPRRLRVNFIIKVDSVLGSSQQDVILSFTQSKKNWILDDDVRAIDFFNSLRDHIAEYASNKKLIEAIKIKGAEILGELNYTDGDYSPDTIRSVCTKVLDGGT